LQWQELSGETTTTKERKKYHQLEFFHVPLDSETEIIAEVGFQISAHKHESNTQTHGTINTRCDTLLKTLKF
jgi:hypothetical protein